MILLTASKVEESTQTICCLIIKGMRVQLHIRANWRTVPLCSGTTQTNSETDSAYFEKFIISQGDKGMEICFKRLAIKNLTCMPCNQTPTGLFIVC